MKKIFLVLVVLALPAISFAKGGQKSLKFGGEGVNSIARVQVFVDKEEAAPRCKCVRFSVLVDDRQSGVVGTTFISKVMVAVEGLDPEEDQGLAAPPGPDPHPETPTGHDTGNTVESD